MDTDSFILSAITKDVIKDLKNWGERFDFSNVHENHELFSKKKRDSCGQFQIRKS